MQCKSIVAFGQAINITATVRVFDKIIFMFMNTSDYDDGHVACSPGAMAIKDCLLVRDPVCLGNKCQRQVGKEEKCRCDSLSLFLSFSLFLLPSVKLENKISRSRFLSHFQDLAFKRFRFYCHYVHQVYMFH